MSLYNATDRSINVTVVSGSTWTGLQNADGSYNVVLADTTFRGTHHPCGAWLVSVAPSNNYYTYNPTNGSYYVSTTPFTNNGMHVTVVSGSLTPGGTATYYIYGF